jgi:hypothetical protein
MTECRDYFTESDFSQADYSHAAKVFYQKKKADRIAWKAEAVQRHAKRGNWK